MLVSYTATPYVLTHRVLECTCSHKKCNGKYLELWNGMEHCLHWYREIKNDIIIT